MAQPPSFIVGGVGLQAVIGGPLVNRFHKAPWAGPKVYSVCLFSL